MTKFFNLTVLLALLAAAASSQTHADDESYDAYEACIKTIGKKLENFKYPGIVTLSMRNLHKKMAADAASCVELLPEDERKDAAYHLRGITLLTQPTDLSGAGAGKIALGSGVVVQTSTGTSLLLSGEAGLSLPKSSLFMMTEGFDLKLSGMAYVGSSETNLELPRFRVSATGTKGLSGKLSKKERAKINAFIAQLAPSKDEEKKKDKDDDKDALEPLLRGYDNASIAHVIRLMFDRDKAMDRDWEASGGYGVQASLGGQTKGLSGHVIGELGAIAGEGNVDPFIRISVGGKGFYCPWSTESKKHLVCLSAELAAKLGLPQAGIGLNVGANYRYKISDNSRGWLNHIDVGPNGYVETLADPNGGHNVGGAMFGVKVQ